MWCSGFAGRQSAGSCDSHLGKVYQNDASQLEKVHRKNMLALFESRGIRALW